MQPSQDRQQTGCGKSCAWCWSALGLDSSDGLKGWRLVLAAAGAFLSPLIQAVLGAVVLPLVWNSPA